MSLPRCLGRFGGPKRSKRAVFEGSRGLFKGVWAIPCFCTRLGAFVRVCTRFDAVVGHLPPLCGGYRGSKPLEGFY